MQVPPELERLVTELAAETQREPQVVLAELLGAALDEDAAFRRQVRAGIAELDGGEGIEHEDAMGRLRTAIEPYGTRTQ